MPDEPESPICPPHHWKIGTADRMETWVCARCNEVKVVDRRAIQAVPFTRGVVRKPDSMPPAPTDLPAELSS